MRTAATCTLHVVDRPGDEPVIVFLHYFGGSSATWSRVVGRLSRYRCVAADLRGFGESAAETGRGYSMAENADDVARMIRRLDLRRYVLVGHSMGGKVAFAFAARRPPGLLSLVLVSPSPPSPEPMADVQRARLLASWGDARAAAETSRTIAAVPLDDAEIALLVRDNLRSTLDAWRAWLEHGSREDLTAFFGDVTVPVWVVAGAADPVFPPPVLEATVVRPLARARMLVLPHVGHLAPLEAPAELASVIARSVASSTASRRSANEIGMAKKRKGRQKNEVLEQGMPRDRR